METVIMVLKVIGIILALLLAVVIFLLFLAMFCRVRYDVAVDAGETVDGKIRLRWLWFVVRFSMTYNDGNTMWVLRVLGIPIKRKKAVGMEKHGRKEKRAPGKKQDVKREKAEDAAEAVERKSDTPESENEESEENRSAAKLLESEFFAKIRGYLLKIRDIFDTIRNIGKKTAGFIKDLPELLRSMREKKSAVVSFWRDKHVQAFLKLSKTQLGCLLVHLKPKKAQGFIRFGTGEPCSTGQILGAAAVAYPLYASWLRVVPEFEEKHFSGYLKARGKIQLFRVILIGKRWFLADTSKRCQSKWKQLKEELTNGR